MYQNRYYQSSQVLGTQCQCMAKVQEQFLCSRQQYQDKQHRVRRIKLSKHLSQDPDLCVNVRIGPQKRENHHPHQGCGRVTEIDRSDQYSFRKPGYVEEEQKDCRRGTLGDLWRNTALESMPMESSLKNGNRQIILQPSNYKFQSASSTTIFDTRKLSLEQGQDQEQEKQQLQWEEAGQKLDRFRQRMREFKAMDFWDVREVETLMSEDSISYIDVDSEVEDQSWLVNPEMDMMHIHTHRFTN